MPDFDSIRALIIDGDGVLWRGGAPLPGLCDFFLTLRRRVLPFVVATNNATAPPQAVQAKLSQFGVEVSLAEILTSAEATAALLRQRLSAGARVLAVGEQGLRMALEQAGFEVVDKADQTQAVVVALDRGMTYDLLAEASLAIGAGALFVGTNPDVNFPSERGLVPGSGAILAALQVTTGRAPLIVGKPEPHLFLEALRRLGTPAEVTLGLGDRLETDIVGGNRAGLPTALVLTGVSRREDLDASPVRPDWVFQDLRAVTQALSRDP
jgi:4-nitrophenyl phosphatase